MLAGRFARAVMFAGATLAGCDQGGGKPTEPSVAKPVGPPGVHGWVTDNHGTPLVGVQLMMQGPAQYNAMSDHHGRYRFEDITAGDYKLTINYNGRSPDGEYANGNAEQTVHVRADEKVDVTLAVTYQQPAMPYGAPPRRHRLV